MGANQSRSGTDNRQQPSQETKTSYYELLDVGRQASEEEIKKAYRRKALDLHPDRNYGNVENTTRLFAEVQSAYEVLSDPQERAWYDSHESAILQDEPSEPTAQYAHNVRITSANEITRMMGQFSSNVEFTDSPTGFFGFLRDAFDQLIREEEAAAQWEGTTAPDYPSFGHKDDEYDEVVKNFYASWNGFSTRKTFSWKDKWRYSEAPDRRVRRLMEKENKKLRDEASREFNDAVRVLVAFAKKRDPRYKPNIQSEAERQQVLREAAAAQAARMRAQNAAKLNEEVPDWAKYREADELEEIDEEESDEEHYECVVCRKTFKSEKQFDAHEKSKKHKKNVQALRRKLRKEGIGLDLDEDDASTDGISTPMSADNVAPDVVNDAQGMNKNASDVKAEASADNKLADEIKKLTLSDESQTPTSSRPAECQSADEDSDKDSSEDENEYGGHQGQTDALPVGVVEQDYNKEAHAHNKLGKAAQKRAKRAAQQAAASQSGSQHECAACNSSFPSKTQLFQHIKDFGHAQPVRKAAKGAKGKNR